MKTINVSLLIIAISLNTIFAQETPTKHNALPEKKSFLELPRIQVIPIKDTKNDRQYELYVKLPEDYPENKDKKYPVIYYTDALWHVEVLSGSAEYIMEEAILVGISWQKDINMDLRKAEGKQASRYRDYSIRKSSNEEDQAKYQFGQAGTHCDFIRNEVIPYMENNYRADSNRRAYFGYSLGSLLGAYILVAQPDTFKNYILGSPSLHRNIPYLSKLLDPAVKNNTHVFISNGTLEMDRAEHIKAFMDLLRAENDEGVTFTYEVIEGSHQTAFPMTAVRGVTWLSNLTK